MSERFKCDANDNESKNTRLPIAKDFANYRFNRDELAHVSRYLFVVEEIIKESKKKNRPLQILDIGCGDIYIARVFQSSFVIKKTEIIKEYTGLDIDTKSLERTKSTAPNSFRINLVQGDITTNALEKFTDGQFDIVVCLETIEHIKPEFVPILLSEIKRISRKSYISTPNFGGGTGKIPKDHIKEWGYNELNKEIEKAGLFIENEFGVFSNLNKVKELSKDSEKLKKIYNFLKDKMDSNFLSLVMAKFINKNAQNIMRVCR